MQPSVILENKATLEGRARGEEFNGMNEMDINNVSRYLRIHF